MQFDYHDSWIVITLAALITSIWNKALFADLKTTKKFHLQKYQLSHCCISKWPSAGQEKTNIEWKMWYTNVDNSGHLKSKWTQFIIFRSRLYKVNLAVFMGHVWRLKCIDPVLIKYSTNVNLQIGPIILSSLFTTNDFLSDKERRQFFTYPSR